MELGRYVSGLGHLRKMEGRARCDPSGVWVTTELNPIPTSHETVWTSAKATSLGEVGRLWAWLFTMEALETEDGSPWLQSLLEAAPTLPCSPRDCSSSASLPKRKSRRW